MYLLKEPGIESIIGTGTEEHNNSSSILLGKWKYGYFMEANIKSYLFLLWKYIKLSKSTFLLP